MRMKGSVRPELPAIPPGFRPGPPEPPVKSGVPDWCARQDLNLHALRHYHLKVARLPIPPRARNQGCFTATRGLEMVGAVRFELTTSCTRNRRASQATLRPGPKSVGKMGNEGRFAKTILRDNSAAAEQFGTHTWTRSGRPGRAARSPSGRRGCVRASRTSCGACAEDPG